MKQITEDYVSFETAKLLKEKGVDFIACVTYYCEDKPTEVYYSFCGETNSTWEKRCCQAPTHQMALKWLREVHSIYITSEPDINDKHCFYPVIYTMTEESWDMQCLEELEKLSFDKPEQAVEAALLYVLKKLI